MNLNKPIAIVFVLLQASTLSAQLTNQDAYPDSKDNSRIAQFLGRGYDAVAGEFADAKYLKQPIYSIAIAPTASGTDTKGNLIDADYDFFRNTSQSDKVTSGETAKEFSKNLSVAAGIGFTEGLYSGEIKANFSDNSAGATDEAFASLHDVKQVFTAKISRTAELVPGVLKELNTISPRKVIAKYGTHYNVGLVFGGRIEFTYSEKSSNNSSMQSLSATAKAAYGGVSANANSTVAQSNIDRLKNGQIFLEIHGGKPVALTVDNFRQQATSGDFIKSQYAEWAGSIAANPTMIGYTSNGLRPIWSVPGLTPQRVKQLQSEVKSYAAERAKGVTERPLNRFAPAIRRIANITLKCGDSFIGRIHDGSSWFPAKGNSGLEIHLYHDSCVTNQSTKATELKSGDPVRLAVVGGNPAKGNKYWLTVQSGNDAYLQEHPLHSKAGWRIWIMGANGKPDGTDPKKTIRDGSSVAFENTAYPGRYLGPDTDYWDIQGNNEHHWFKIKNR